MENQCNHPTRSREQYNDKVSKCHDCGKILTRYYPLSESDIKLIDEMDKKYKTGPYAPFLKRYRTEIKSWIISVGIMSAVMLFIYLIFAYPIMLAAISIAVLVCAAGCILYWTKEAIKRNMFDE